MARTPLFPVRESRARETRSAPDDDLPDEKTLLRTWGHRTLSGLAAVGNLLDLPGSSVRDLLGGKNPLDQWLSPLQSRNRLTGRELLTRWGLTKPNDPDKWEGADFAGFAAEVLTDPLSALSLGASAIGRGGQVLKRAGLFDDFVKQVGKGKRLSGMTSTLGDAAGHYRNLGQLPAIEALETAAKRMGFDSLDSAVGQIGKEPLRGLAGLGVPFRAPSMVLGTGARSQKIARALDLAGQVMGDSKIGVLAKGVFSSRARNQFTVQGQKLAGEVDDALSGVAPEIAAQQRHSSRVYYEAHKALEESFGDYLTRPNQPVAIDSRDIRQRALEMLDPELAQFEANMPEFYRWKSENLPFVNNVRRNAERDWDAITDSDLALREIRNLPEMAEKTDNEIWELLLKTKDPRPVTEDFWNRAKDQIEQEFAQAGDARWEATRQTLDPDYVAESLKRAPDELAEELSDVYGADFAQYRTAKEMLEAAAEFVAEESGQLFPKGAARSTPWNTMDVVEWTETMSDKSVVNRQGIVTETGSRESRVLLHDPKTGELFDKVLPNSLNQGGKRTFPDVRKLEPDSPEAVTWKARVAQKKLDEMLYDAGDKGTLDRLDDLAEEAGQEAGGVREKLDETVRELNTLKDTVHRRILEMGGKSGEHTLEAGFKTGHMPRTGKKGWFEQKLQNRGVQTAFASMTARTPELRDMARNDLNRIVTDRRYRGPVQTAAKNIYDDFYDALDETWGQAPAAERQGQLFDEGADAAQAADEARMLHARAIAEHMSGKGRADLYRRTLKAEMDDYLEGGYRTQAGLEAIHNFVKLNATDALEEGTVPLSKAYESAGLKPDKALEYFSRMTGMTPEAVSGLRVAPDVAAAIAGYEGIMKPKRLEGPLLKLWDDVTQLFKTNVTIKFPSFWGRNYGSGQVVNLTSGYVELSKPSDVRAYLNSHREARKLVGRIDKELAEGGLSPEMTDLLQELADNNVVSRNLHFEDVDVSDLLPHEAEGLGGIVPDPRPWQIGRTRDEVRQALSREAESGAATVLDKTAAGRALHLADRTWSGTGAKANQWVEWQNRVSMYLHLKKKGYSPKAAADVVERLHFDYGKVTATEREVFKRAAPFYTFTRKMAEQLWTTLTEQPGGALAQLGIRAPTAAQGRGESDLPLPEYVAQTAAIPWGKLPSGSQSYLTGLGLAHEAPLSYLSVRNGLPDLGDTLGEVAASLNPLIKGPLELAAGESFFQRGPSGGRELTDMDPTAGRLLTNIGLREEGPNGRAKPLLGSTFEHVLANSPATRYLSTLRHLTDPRKYEGGLFPGQYAALGFLTGVKRSDISPAAQEATLRDMAQSAATEEGAKTFSTVTYTKAMIEEARARGDEQAARKMESYNALMGLLTRNAKARKKSALEAIVD